MKLVLDPTSPVPLYHQIAEALGYRIATGRVRAGERLPSVRAAAAAWAVNMHTVRRAYAEVAERGLVEIRGAHGTIVRGRRARRSAGDEGAALDEFLEATLEEARGVYGLAQHELAQILANWSPRRPESADVVHVVECSETECADHVREIEARWQVDARPWCLSRQGEPPPGPILATYFHYNEVYRRWPHRLHEIRFAAIRPDPGLVTSIAPLPPSTGRRTLVLYEFDEPMARNIAADLSAIFPARRYHIKPRVVARGTKIIAAAGARGPLLLSPRVWDSLGPRERTDPRAIKVVYAFPNEELENIGAHFGWRSRRPLRQRRRPNPRQHAI